MQAILVSFVLLNVTVTYLQSIICSILNGE